MLVRPIAFDNGADDFAEGLARFADAGKVGFFDERGWIAIPARYGWAGRFSEGRAAVCRGCAEVAVGEHREVHGGRWGYVDRDGKEVVPLRFDRADPFRGGLATVLLAGRTFWIRPDGNEAVPIDAGR